MPNQPMTVHPVVQETADGQEYIADFAVNNAAPPGVGRDGRDVGWENDWHMDSEGHYHHVFENVELESDIADQGIYFDEDSYVDALLETNSEFRQAQAWATQNLSAQDLADFNDAVDNGNLEELNECVEWLIDEYKEAVGVPETFDEYSEAQEGAEMEELSEEENQVLEQTVEALMQQEPQGVDVSSQWLQASSQAHDSGDGTYALVAASVAAFHQGEMDAQTAIDYCFQHASPRELARVYKHLTGN